MSYFNSALPFVDHSCRRRMPQRLTHVFESLSVDLSDDAGSGLRIRTSSVDDWWFNLVEGRGRLALFTEDLDSFSNHATLVLTLRGQHASLDRRSLCPPPARQLFFGLSSRWGASSSSGNFSYLCIYIPVDQLGEHDFENIPYGYSMGVEQGAGAVLSSAMCKLVDEVIDGGDSHSIAGILPAFSNLAITTLSQKRVPTALPDPNARRMRRIMDCLNSYFSDPDLDPNQVAAMVGVSRRQLDREFEQAGDTFSRRLRVLRLNKARALLRTEAGMSITRVAYEVGFSCPTVFGRHFRAHFGETPSEFCQGLSQ